MTNPETPAKTPVKKQHIALALLLLVVAAVLGTVFMSTRSPSTTRTSAAMPALNQKAVEFVNYVVIEDIKTGMSGGESAAWKTGDFLPLLQIDSHAKAKEYEDAYDANEIAADNKFKGKKILLSGDVVSIDKDFTESGIVTLRGSGLMGIRAELSANGMVGAASFVKGQHVDLVCKGTGRVMTVATLDDCIPFQDYLNGLSPSVQSRLSDFLRGQTVLSKQTAVIITGMYVIGMSMPADSPCINGARDKCAGQISSLLADKTKMQAIQTQTMQMMKSLKVY